MVRLLELQLLDLQLQVAHVLLIPSVIGSRLLSLDCQAFVFYDEDLDLGVLANKYFAFEFVDDVPNLRFLSLAYFVKLALQGLAFQ